MHRLLILIIICSFSFVKIIAQKEYYRAYHTNGSVKSAGWKVGNAKVDYWYQYYSNGNIAEQGQYKNNKKVGYWYFYSKNSQPLREGHFKDNKAENWWIIYDIASQKNDAVITRKYQYQNNKKNGYCFLYKNNKLFKAEKYIDDRKIGEWTDVFNFKKDNPSVSL